MHDLSYNIYLKKVGPSTARCGTPHVMLVFARQRIIDFGYLGSTGYITLYPSDRQCTKITPPVF